MNFNDKHIILGVCGGIAAYKSVELLRLLKKEEADVRVIMTENAQWFVGPLTFEALSGRAVCTNLFKNDEDAGIRHIQWAETADAVVVAPATANIIGKLASGIADDALSTFMTAVTCPVLLCPSMNSSMYENRAVQRNMATLINDGYLIVAPDSGSLACGTVGPGRLPEPEEILQHVMRCLSPQDFAEKRVLVTAGPTIEPIDPVRYIGNPSSGKMGFALAKAAMNRGASVTLITGPTTLPDPVGASVIRIQTTSEMADKVFEHMSDSDIVIKAAAVSDYRPVETSLQKIKKSRNEMDIHLEKTVDILESLGKRKTHQVLVGFAAETEDLERNAQAKLQAKNLDMIVGNLIGKDGAGFQSDTNTVTLFMKNGSAKSLPSMAKDALAHIILNRINELLVNDS